MRPFSVHTIPHVPKRFGRSVSRSPDEFRAPHILPAAEQMAPQTKRRRLHVKARAAVAQTKYGQAPYHVKAVAGSFQHEQAFGRRMFFGPTHVP